MPIGATESYPLPGVTVLLRVETRAWGRDDQGNLTQGCFRVAGVYLPEVSVVSPEVDGWTRAAGILTVVSLAVGTIVTLTTWGKK